MNGIENVWNRILAHCSINLVTPEYVFTTITGIKFYIIKIDTNTIHPFRIDRNSKLFDIKRSVIENDLDSGRPINGDNPGIYGAPAPSYRYGLLNDIRIYI